MKKKNKFMMFIVGLLFMIMFISSMLFIFLLVKNNILPNKYKVPLFIAVGLINIFILVQIIRSKVWSTFFIVLIFSGVFIWGNYYIIEGINVLDMINMNALTSKSQMSIAVLKDSTIDSVDDLNDKKVIAPFEIDKSNIDKYKEKLSENGYNILIENTSSYEKAAIDLLESKTDAILINKAYVSNINQVVKGFDDKVKYIDNVELIKKESHSSIDVGKEQSFNVYLSGIDTYGSIQNESRSDVNIIMTVNPVTKKILLTSIPRDSYVRVADNGADQLDKLTHAGVYGVMTSVHTIENLLDIKVNYFARINFTSFIDIVDTIGGVEVENPVSFGTRNGRYYFDEGTVELTGDSALWFSRERYNLAGGDNDRGKNQERVIKAILNKVMSPAILSNYVNILNDISSSVQTNMSKDKIIELVNMQLDDNAKWEINMQVLSGSGATDSCYAAGGQMLYVTKLNEEVTNRSIKNINNILEGRDFEKPEEKNPQEDESEEEIIEQ